MLNLGCGQYLRNPFFPGFWGQKWGCGFCILADYTRLYTVNQDSCRYHLKKLWWRMFGGAKPLCHFGRGHYGDIHVKLFLIWISGSGGDVVLRFFLENSIFSSGAHFGFVE